MTHWTVFGWLHPFCLLVCKNVSPCCEGICLCVNTKKLHLWGQTITRSPKFCKNPSRLQEIRKSKAVRWIFSRFFFSVVQALFDHYPVMFKLLLVFLLMLVWSRDGGQIANKMPLVTLTCIKMQNLGVVWAGSLKLLNDKCHWGLHFSLSFCDLDGFSRSCESWNNDQF